MLVAKLTFCWAEMTETSVALHLTLITFCHEQRMHSTHPFLLPRKRRPTVLNVTFFASVSRNSFAENIVQENVHLVLKSTYLKGLENKGFKIGVPTIESSLFDVRWCISNMVGWFSLVTKRDTNSNKTRCLCLDACIQFISLV